jgi:peptidoglycan/xylan/chitin deacetylase (PgdA/CDA1 family)
MYHGVRANAGNSHSYYDIHTSPSVFAAHMEYLFRKGYKTVGLEEAFQITSGLHTRVKVVAITFDDGYLDFYTSAFPVLLSFGFTATVFAVPGFAAHDMANGRRDYMNWEEIREIHAHGIRIGSHTMTHADLLQMDTEGIDRELYASKRAIEDKLGCEAPCFSYPYSFPKHHRRFVQLIRSQLKANGYRFAVSTILGSVHQGCDRYLLPRLPLNAHDDLRLFAAKLEGAYDWMEVAQSIHKIFTPTNHARSRHTASAAPQP